MNDRLALAELAARYAVAVDRRDPDLLRRLFADDATVLLPESLAGAYRLVTDPARLLDPLGRFERTRHTVAQQVVEVDGDTATGETYGEAHHLYRRGDELRDYVLALRYLDMFVRTTQGWRFSRRELVVDWAAKQNVHEP